MAIKIKTAQGYVVKASEAIIKSEFAEMRKRGIRANVPRRRTNVSR